MYNHKYFLIRRLRTFLNRSQNGPGCYIQIEPTGELIAKTEIYINDASDLPSYDPKFQFVLEVCVWYNLQYVY